MTEHTMRYDVYYDINTGEILEKICNCQPGTCEFTDNWIADGKPTKVPAKYQEHMQLHYMEEVTKELDLTCKDGDTYWWEVDRRFNAWVEAQEQSNHI